MTEQQKALWHRAQKRYSDAGSIDNFSALLMGRSGVGKTTMLMTARRPIRIYAFDPSYEALPDVRNAINDGWCHVELLNDEDTAKPAVYKRFKQIVDEEIKVGLLDLYGTVAIDTGTMMMPSAVNAIRSIPNIDKPAMPRPAGGLFLSDYRPFYSEICNQMLKLSSVKADFILAMHTVLEKDELSGSIVEELDVFKGLKPLLMGMFAEKYYLEKLAKNNAVEYSLYTNSQKKFTASTRIGSKKFEIKEKPDFKYLLEKAGRPFDDKPNLT